MTDYNKPSFSDRALNQFEAFQYHFGKTRFGGLVVTAFTGSSSPAYEQLLWLPRSQVQSATISQAVEVPGDPYARGSARLWDRLAVLAVNQHEMQRLRTADNQEAVAYIADKVVHVGIMATEGALLSDVGYDQAAVAVRRGPGDATFTVGVYAPDQQAFTSVANGGVKIRDGNLPLHLLPASYPGVKLV